MIKQRFRVKALRAASSGPFFVSETLIIQQFAYLDDNALFNSAVYYEEHMCFQAFAVFNFLTDFQAHTRIGLWTQVGIHHSGYNQRDTFERFVAQCEAHVLFVLVGSNRFRFGTESKPVATDENEQYVSFTLRNETLKSIPLIIPGVMNPNLSPQSNSGVRLKIGQEIKYRKGLKTHVLFIVDGTIEEGVIIKVGKLLDDKGL